MMTDEAELSHTNWSLIFDSASGNQAAATAAIERLVRRYWPAVFAFFRQTGRSIDESSDLTQAFVCDVVLLRQLFQRATPQRGRFRNLLLTSLQNFSRDQRRTNARQKRTDGRSMVPLNEAEVAAGSVAGMTPEQAFSAQWSATVVRRALDRVRRTCAASGMEVHWRVFEARVVDPMLFDQAPVPHATLVDRLDLDDSGQAANMMVAVKRKFVRALVEEIGLTVEEPLQIETELRELLKDLEVRS
jgi:DNA-directed RNA polymerase specialized sigma24 family protein